MFIIPQLFIAVKGFAKNFGADIVALHLPQSPLCAKVLTNRTMCAKIISAKESRKRIGGNPAPGNGGDNYVSNII